MAITKVRITVTDGMSRKQVHEDTFAPADKTPSIAVKDLIDAAVVLRDGDTIEVSFIDETAVQEALLEHEHIRNVSRMCVQFGNGPDVSGA